MSVGRPFRGTELMPLILDSIRNHTVPLEKWRVSYMRKGKLDILQEEGGGKTVIVILRTEALAVEEGGGGEIEFQIKFRPVET